MNIWKPTRLEWLTFFALAPVLTGLLNYLLFGDRLWNDGDVLLRSVPLVAAIVLLSWYMHVLAMHWFRFRFPQLRQTGMRITLLVFTHVLMTASTFALIFFGYDAIGFLGYSIDVGQFKLSLVLAVAVTAVATTLWEAEYVLVKWKESISEKEQVEQLAIRHEFETLKNQVNPHFLFNCFNTLSSLIGEDKKQAEKFLDELSKVYRYLLRNNEDGLSTVKNEIQFIESYYQLLRTRHGDAISMQIEIDKRYESYLLPSLSLQMLVENAVKHNVLSKNYPLVIEIVTVAANRLVVNNNLQRRARKAPSNSVGLENIRLKYRLLGQEGFQVMEEEKNFTVVLPLIWNSGADKSIAFAQGKQTEAGTLK